MPRSELVQSLSRATDMLDLASQSEHGLALVEICDTLGLKRTTVYNLIRTLVAKGLLEKTDRPIRYRLGPSIMRLAAAQRQFLLIRKATTVLPEFLRRVMDMFGLSNIGRERISISFGQIIVGEVTQVLRAQSRRPTALDRPYLQFETYSSAASLVFQAYWDPKALTEFRRRHPFADEGASHWESEEKLDEFLAQVQELGYAAPPLYGKEEVRMAAPVFDISNQLSAALGIGVWAKTSAAQRREVRKYLTESAKAISQQPIDEPAEAAEVN